MKLRKATMLVLCIAMLAALLVGCARRPKYELGHDALNVMWNDYVVEQKNPLGGVLPFYLGERSSDAFTEGSKGRPLFIEEEGYTNSEDIADLIDVLARVTRELKNPLDAQDEAVQGISEYDCLGVLFPTGSKYTHLLEDKERHSTFGPGTVKIWLFENRVLRISMEGAEKSAIFQLSERAYQDTFEVMQRIVTEA